MPLSREEIARYSRHLLLPEVGLAGQERLKKSRVLLVGAGGLGAPVGYYLAAAGVGHITIIDHDDIDASNLQRQILFAAADVGKSKAEVAAAKLLALNPLLQVHGLREKFSHENAERLVAGADLVIDATDNFATRYLCNDVCVLLRKPLVFAAIFRFEGQVSVLAQRGQPCYRCLFPVPPDPQSVPNCAEAGVLGVLPGIMGTLQANEAIKTLLGKSDTLAGSLLTFDALRAEFNKFKVPMDPLCPACGEHPELQKLLKPATAMAKAVSVPEISAAELAERMRREKLQLLDVRTAEEVAICSIPQALHIPLAQVTDRLEELQPQVPIVVYCKAGGRSQTAGKILQEHGFAHVQSLKGGILAWAATVDPTLNIY